jgi:hypothetical protein
MLTAILLLLQEEELKASMLMRYATYIQASTIQLNAQYFML